MSERAACLLASAALVVLTACGGGASTSPVVQATPTPPPSISALVSGGRFVANGSKGVTFTFTMGSGVPPGETAAVSLLPPTPPCSGTGCSALNVPLDGFEISVGPQPVPIAAFASVVLGGVPSSNLVAMFVGDATDSGAFTFFRFIDPTGGPLVLTTPSAQRPVLVLAPNHVYEIAILGTGMPPP